MHSEKIEEYSKINTTSLQGGGQDRIKAQHEKGKYLRYMLDQELASAQLKDAQERLAVLETLNLDALKNPVTVSPLPLV